LSTNQIDKPILNIFRMFGKLAGQRVKSSSPGQVSLDDILAHSVRNQSDVGVLAAYNTTTRTLSAMIWNYHDDDLPKPDAQVTLDVSGLGEHWDNSHSNSYTRWLEVGAPQNPTDDQIADLKAAGQLQMLRKPVYVPVRDGKVEIEFALPIHGTSLLMLKEQ
jgi:xylan 1,4-beta-xylosidase